MWVWKSRHKNIICKTFYDIPPHSKHSVKKRQRDMMMSNLYDVMILLKRPKNCHLNKKLTLQFLDLYDVIAKKGQFIYVK